MNEGNSIPKISNYKSEIVLLLLVVVAVITLIFIMQERTKRAPDFEAEIYPTLEETFNLNENIGTPILINFWASWCVPCEVEFPHIQKMRDKYKKDDLIIFGINSFDLTEDAISFLNRLNISFQTGPDPNGEINDLYEITGLPVTIFIDKQGIIQQKKIGYIDEETLQKWISKEIE
tara:strand:- start:442 stop:969 length:528 start_codon:yes stop_codon:yes gene_type:complete